MNENSKKLIASRFTTLRKFVLLLIKTLPFDIKIRNPYSGKHFTVNFYRHKGYWFYGKHREEDTARSLGSLVTSGNTVIEAGGHIGFLTHLYSHLVGPSGNVYVFEPGSNNLPYAKTNLKSLSNVTLLEKGCSDFSGTANFYLDGLTGQNNSLHSDYDQVEAVARSHFEAAKRTATRIPVIRLDEFIDTLAINPDHVKIDVEGAEIAVLRGMGRYLGIIPSLMVEIRQNHQEVYSLMEAKGYISFDDKLSVIQTNQMWGRANVFFRLDSKAQ
jgi:FkbM family methyltransferase